MGSLSVPRFLFLPERPLLEEIFVLWLLRKFGTKVYPGIESAELVFYRDGFEFSQKCQEVFIITREQISVSKIVKMLDLGDDWRILRFRDYFEGYRYRVQQGRADDIRYLFDARSGSMGCLKRRVAWAFLAFEVRYAYGDLSQCSSEQEGCWGPQNVWLRFGFSVSRLALEGESTHGMSSRLRIGFHDWLRVAEQVLGVRYR